MPERHVCCTRMYSGLSIDRYAGARAVSQSALQCTGVWWVAYPPLRRRSRSLSCPQCSGIWRVAYPRLRRPYVVGFADLKCVSSSVQMSVGVGREPACDRSYLTPSANSFLCCRLIVVICTFLSDPNTEDLCRISGEPLRSKA